MYRRLSSLRGLLAFVTGNLIGCDALTRGCLSQLFATWIDKAGAHGVDAPLWLKLTSHHGDTLRFMKLKADVDSLLYIPTSPPPELS